jgi:hypothetical protein
MSTNLKRGMFDCGKKSRRGKYMRKCEKRKRRERYNNRFQISFEKSVKREKKNEK